ncbi:MAG: helix-turn-helix transcriptional regulator [bacterium]|nr:helix-turn-helix transcriptional regulator [bacterium]
MEIGKRLKVLRKKLGLTQKELSARIKGRIDYSYIGKIEREEQNPSLKIIKKIAEAMHVRPEYFFTDHPVEQFLGSEQKQNEKRDLLLKQLCRMNDEELNFITGIIKFISQYKDIQGYYKPLKIADKKGKYKAG